MASVQVVNTFKAQRLMSLLSGHIEAITPKSITARYMNLSIMLDDIMKVRWRGYLVEYNEDIRSLTVMYN